jgi:hypothetical protein
VEKLDAGNTRYMIVLPPAEKNLKSTNGNLDYRAEIRLSTCISWNFETSHLKYQNISAGTGFDRFRYLTLKKEIQYLKLMDTMAIKNKLAHLPCPIQSSGVFIVGFAACRLVGR